MARSKIELSLTDTVASQNTPRKGSNRGRKIGFVVFAILCVLIALVSQRFWLTPPNPATENMAHYRGMLWGIFLTHVVMASVALVILPIQFSTRLRNRRRALHRFTGRIYGVAVLLGAISGFVMAWNAPNGFLTSLGFALLAVAWLTVTARAILLARAGRISEHRVWMIRSAALTFAAVTLRLELPLLAASFGFPLGYAIVAWSCWVINWIVVEMYLARRNGTPMASPA